MRPHGFTRQLLWQSGEPPNPQLCSNRPVTEAGPARPRELAHDSAATGSCEPSSSPFGLCDQPKTRMPRHLRTWSRVASTRFTVSYASRQISDSLKSIPSTRATSVSVMSERASDSSQYRRRCSRARSRRVGQVVSSDSGTTGTALAIPVRFFTGETVTRQWFPAQHTAMQQSACD